MFAPRAPRPQTLVVLSTLSLRRRRTNRMCATSEPPPMSVNVCACLSSLSLIFRRSKDDRHHARQRGALKTTTVA